MATGKHGDAGKGHCKREGCVNSSEKRYYEYYHFAAAETTTTVDIASSAKSSLNKLGTKSGLNKLGTLAGGGPLRSSKLTAKLAERHRV